MKVLSAIVIAGGLALAAPAQDAASRVQVLAEANDLFHQANERAATDLDGAQALYTKAARRFERLVSDGGIENGKLFYNLGNTYFRMGDIGRALLVYRRAEAYRPNDPNLHRNMQFARARRLDTFEEPQTTRVLKTLFFWHYDLSQRSRAVLFGAFFGAAWLLATVRILAPRGWLAWLLAGAALLAALLLGSLAADVAHMRRVQPGVILAEEVVARKGDSRSYEPSFKEPLHAGTEFIRLESRGDWFRVALPDGSECWLPESAVGMVR